MKSYYGRAYRNALSDGTIPDHLCPLSVDWRAPKTPIAIISGTDKFTDFKFGRYINSAQSNWSPLTILERRERGRIQELLKFFGYPLLSQEGVKLQTSNFVCIFTGSIGLSEQKSIKNVGKSSFGRSQGLPKIFRAAIYRSVIFAIAQLSFIQTVHRPKWTRYYQ